MKLFLLLSLPTLGLLAFGVAIYCFALARKFWQSLQTILESEELYDR